MKRIYFATVVFVFSVAGASAESDYYRLQQEKPAPMPEHQKAMLEQIDVMREVLQHARNSEDTDSRKNATRKHAESLRQGIAMLQETMTEKRRRNLECMQREYKDPEIRICREPETHMDTFMNMLLAVFDQHMQDHLLAGN